MNQASVLIADGEDTFREPTCHLLRHEGYNCRCVPDAEAAFSSLQHGHYDVLVADIPMPHDPDLPIITQAREVDKHLSVVLVTGYPSIETAVRAIALEVEGYLTKPIDTDEFLALLDRAVRRSRNRRRVSLVMERLQSVVAYLKDHASPKLLQAQTHDDSLATLLSLASCLSDLPVLWRESAMARDLCNLCDLVDCPQLAIHQQVVREAIEILEDTEESLTSERLAELRARLQEILGNASS